MIDHANELRRYARKIGHPAGDVPSVMLAAAGEIERLAARLEAAEKERDECNRRRLEAADHFAAQTALMKQKYDDLRAKIEATERQEPVGVLHVGNYYGEELQDWEFEANQCACDKLNEVYVSNPTSLPLYAIPGAKGDDNVAAN